MVYKLLLSGYRPAFTIVTFDPSAGTIKLVSESPAPKAASWIEPGKTDPKLTNSSGSHVFYTTGKSSSDGQGGEGFRTDKDGNKGFMVSLEVKGDEVRITGQKETFGGPAHSKCGLFIRCMPYSGGEEPSWAALPRDLHNDEGLTRVNQSTS